MWIIFAISVVVIAAVWSGWWRFALWPFRIPTRKMTVARLGLHVTESTAIHRVNSILASFAGGFNRALISPRADAWRAHTASLSPLYEPFSHEGAAMAYWPRRAPRASADDFEQQLVRARPDFRYLYYVGLGFWAGMSRWSFARLSRVVNKLDPLHGYLCYDGYGFKLAFFDLPKNPRALDVLRRFSGYARNAAFQGVGRALFFRFMDDRQGLITAIDRLGEHAVDAAAGVGLAAVFVNPDRLHWAQDIAGWMKPEWQPHFHLGMCFGLKARSINNVDVFEANVDRLPSAMKPAVFASVRECDRVELLVRSDGQADAYRRWRERVTAWMIDHIEYPMQRLIERDAPTFNPTVSPERTTDSERKEPVMHGSV